MKTAIGCLVVLAGVAGLTALAQWAKKPAKHQAA